MFTGLNEIHFPALPLVEPNVNTEDINGKQTMERISWGAVTLPQTHVITLCFLHLFSHTHIYTVMACYNHTQCLPLTPTY